MIAILEEVNPNTKTNSTHRTEDEVADEHATSEDGVFGEGSAFLGGGVRELFSERGADDGFNKPHKSSGAFFGKRFIFWEWLLATTGDNRKSVADGGSKTFDTILEKAGEAAKGVGHWFP